MFPRGAPGPIICGGQSISHNPSPDAIAEFKTLRGQYSAEFGRNASGQINVITKSGTNSIHGSAYEFYRDPGITANNWFNKQTQENTGSPNIPSKILVNTYGASLGAPLIKDKLFFFGAYEGQHRC